MHIGKCYYLPRNIVSYVENARFIHSDRYSLISRKLNGYLLIKGLVSSNSTPYYHQVNGQVRRHSYMENYSIESRDVSENNIENKFCHRPFILFCYGCVPLLTVHPISVSSNLKVVLIMGTRSHLR